MPVTGPGFFALSPDWLKLPSMNDTPHTLSALVLAIALPWGAMAPSVAMASVPSEVSPARPKAPLVVARVDGEPISATRLDMITWQAGVRQPGQPTLTQAQALDQAIDLQLQARQALMLGLDQHPRVQELIEIARQEVLARAYNDQARESVPEPTQQAINSYHDAHPELFSQRKVYMIQELILAPTTQSTPELRRLVGKATSMAALVDSLKKEGVDFKVNQVTQPAENLPLDQLRELAQAKEGKPYLKTRPGTSMVGIYVVMATRSEPRSRDAAQPMIKLFLTNTAHQARQAEALKALRQKARIERLEVPTAAP